MAASARPYHHGNLRAELLDRAIEVVGTDGVDALSLRALARDLGVSHGAPSRHFPDRQALLDAVAVLGFERLAERLAAGAEGDGGLRERLHALARAYVGFATTYGALLDLMFAGKHRPGAEAVAAASAAAFGPVERLLDEALAAGELTGSRDEVGIALLSLLQGLSAFGRLGWLDGVGVDAAATIAVDRLLDGLRPR